MEEHVHSVFDVRIKKSVIGNLESWSLCIHLGDFCRFWPRPFMAGVKKKSAGLVRTTQKTSLVAIAQ